MKKRDDFFFIKNILDSILEIQKYVTDLTEVEFAASSLHSNATIRLLEVIGEASKQISPALKVQYPDIPWAAMAKMRDRLIHHYFGIDMQVVWLVATKELPALQTRIEKILAKA